VWRGYRLRATPSCGSALHFLPAALPTVMSQFLILIIWYFPNRADRFMSLSCTSNRKLSLVYLIALSVSLCVSLFVCYFATCLDNTGKGAQKCSNAN
jgi:hypothetical protein